MTRRSARRVRGLLLIPLGFALSACAVGNAKYGCPGLPDKPLCLPPSSIYALTEGQGPPPAARRRPSTLKSGARAPCCSTTKADDAALGWADDRTTTGEQL